MKVLGIDTATESATCAVIDDNKLLGEITFNHKKQHSVIIMPMIDMILKDLQIDINDIDGFAISKGPGSFTGLRIGIANIKGLCQALNKPFVGISSLDALAYNMAYSEGIICPILDALRENVYTAQYKFENCKLTKTSDYSIEAVYELIEKLNDQDQKVHFIGDGTYKYREKLEKGLVNADFAPIHMNLVKASTIAELGMAILKDGYKEDIYSFAPIYLRKSQAEREYEKKMESSKNE